MTSTVAHRPAEPSPQCGPPTVFIVDDDVSARVSLEAIVRRAGWHPQTFETGRQFLARPRVVVPGCLLVDVSLADMSGFDLQQRVAPEGLPVIFVTGTDDVPTSVRAIKAGAIEYLMKPLDEDVLLAAIGVALEHSVAQLVETTTLQTLQSRYASLTRREREVMALVVSGLLNKQVGFELGISEITVKAHRGKAMRKMKAPSFLGLVDMAATLRRAHWSGQAVFGR